VRAESGACLLFEEYFAVRIRNVTLAPEQRKQLLHLRDHSPKPYLRERAAAILQIADGAIAAIVAREGLLRSRAPDTVRAWLDRWEESGLAGLKVLPGRGRKPAFSPCVPGTRGRQRGRAPRRAA